MSACNSANVRSSCIGSGAGVEGAGVDGAGLALEAAEVGGIGVTGAGVLDLTPRVGAGDGERPDVWDLPRLDSRGGPFASSSSGSTMSSKISYSPLNKVEVKLWKVHAAVGASAPSARAFSRSLAWRNCSGAQRLRRPCVTIQMMCDGRLSRPSASDLVSVARTRPGPYHCQSLCGILTAAVGCAGGLMRLKYTKSPGRKI